MNIMENFAWTEKYSPKTVADMVLPIELKKTFQNFVDQGYVPNLTLAGGAGQGKTAAAKAMLSQLGCDYIVINASMNGNIDTLRNEILQFATSMSFTGGKKYVILDEADYLTPTTMGALRNFMEEYSKNCHFILTCNYKNRIIEPLLSRAPVVDFVTSKKEVPKLALQFMKRVEYILQQENVSYDKNVIVALIQRDFPDFRKILNVLQRYASGTESIIDSGILGNMQDVSIKEVFSHCKEKKFEDMRKWVHDNSDLEPVAIFRAVYDNCQTYMSKRSVPLVILKIAEYQYKSAFVVDQTINTMAFLIEIAMEGEFN